MADDAIFTKKDFESFREAADNREEDMRWPEIFPEGTDHLALSLITDSSVKSMQEDVEGAITEHNRLAKLAYEAAVAKGDAQAGKLLIGIYT